MDLLTFYFSEEIKSLARFLNPELQNMPISSQNHKGKFSPEVNPSQVCLFVLKIGFSNLYN